MVRARRILQSLWNQAWLKGRCWGPQTENNPYAASNITIAVGDELVSISQRDSQLVIHEFVKSTGTQLGKKVRELFKEGGLIQGTVEVFSPLIYTAFCSVCGWRKTFDPGLPAETDSRGQGSRELARKIYEAHSKEYPRCNATNIVVLDQNSVKQDGFIKLIPLH
ncbi:MAG: hypothetical protein A2Z68_01675 [Candidatus Nealsonbacteria bacterium RBG_13_38_11]|uniref:Uncharacterized protein n=1 Tax=Candidatus Nealsonbacteria bacterium RBG_13_38_11 TaxID=1801662 RepID=A0A1G2E187_9BACT|nr:MAG: hypothetical protein A2Z68_01675 [Candidatus Nealsonbacteria bacterium RBG_13_38_11]